MFIVYARPPTTSTRTVHGRPRGAAPLTRPHDLLAGIIERHRQENFQRGTLTWKAWGAYEHLMAAGKPTDEKASKQ